MIRIIDYLKTSGEKFDSVIADAMGIPLDKTREYLSVLSVSGELMFCHTIRFIGEHKIDCMSYRIAGYLFRNKPGAKTTAQLKLN